MYTPEENVAVNPEQTAEEPKAEENPAPTPSAEIPPVSNSSKMGLKIIIAVLLLVIAGLFGALFLRRGEEGR